MHNQHSISTPVAKTALDALNSKLSAVNCGFTPIKKEQNGDLYIKFLNEMNKGLHECDYDDNDSNSKPIPIRRQSPLVNAGYSCRVAALSQMIYEFIHSHTKSKINVVIMGSGFDVLGLWAGTFDNVMVYEVDCYENNDMKFKALTNMGLIRPVNIAKCEMKLKNENGINGDCLHQGWLQKSIIENCSKKRYASLEGKFFILQ